MPALHRSYLTLPVMLWAVTACSAEAPTTAEESSSSESASLEACGTAPDAIRLTSKEQVRTLMSQVWRACGPGLLQAPPVNGDAGIEFNPDGRWYVMTPAADGTLVRTSVGGTWLIEAGFDGQSFFLTFSSLEIEGSFGLELAFRGSPLTVDMSFNGQVFATYTADRAAVAPPRRPDAATCGYWGFAAPPPTPDRLQPLLGRWRKCGSGAMFTGSITEDDGVEFASNGTWYQLATNPNGSLARRGLSGTYSLFENLLGFQLDMRAPSNAFPGGEAAFGGLGALVETPHKLRIRAGDNVTYVFDGEAPPRRVREHEVSLEVQAGACEATGLEPLVMRRGKDFTRALVGRWARCNTTPFFSNDEYVGIEFLKDGRFFGLYPGPTPGTVIRGHGFDRAGSWDAQGNEDARPPQNPFGFGILVHGEGTYLTGAQLTAGVSQLNFFTFLGTPTFAKDARDD